MRREGDGHPRLVVAGWLAGTVLVPTLVPTKLAWYLTPFYPGAAVLTALALHAASQASCDAGRRGRAHALVALTVAAVLVVEGRLVYRSVVMLDLGRSAQGLLIAHADVVRGARVFATACPYPEAFVARVAGGRCVATADVATARRAAVPGDLWLDGATADVPGLLVLGRNRRASLHRVP